MYKYTHFICAVHATSLWHKSNKQQNENEKEKKEMEREKTSAGENGHRKTLIQTEVCKCGVTTVQLERHLNVTIECIFFFSILFFKYATSFIFSSFDYTLSIL